SATMQAAYVERGIMKGSGEIEGLTSEDAKSTIVESLEKPGLSEKTTQYTLRDWLGTPQSFRRPTIPVVYCDKCGAVPVPENQLPVKPPRDVQFTCSGNPLVGSESFINTTCAKCEGAARRETDTMDTFVDSSLYFLRYVDPLNTEEPF